MLLQEIRVTRSSPLQPSARVTNPARIAGTVESVMDSPIRLLLVDDEARVRQGLRMCMAGEPDFDVIGEAGEGLAAISMVSALHPEVVVLDVHMRGMDGIQATRELAVSAPSTRVVILSLQDDSVTRSEALASGASAFVGKQEGIPRLFEVIRSVAGRARAS
jgi:DNA-binding NarL/FixJ family response regulator